MNYWIFTVTTQSQDGKNYPAVDVFGRRAQDGFWGMGPKTPNRNNLRKGDRVVFYLGAPQMAFAGTCELKSSYFKLNAAQKSEFGKGEKFYAPDFGVMLDKVEKWPELVPITRLLSLLSFIENTEYWFAYFQGGIRQISEADYGVITNTSFGLLTNQIQRAVDVVDQGDFALETHLEEFIAQNWKSIDWGASLRLDGPEGQTGRQFPAGLWSIDFLAHDQKSGDLVVIELKRGKTSDSTVGQVLRYMNWVRENVAQKGQQVRGLIVAKEVDEALKYAVMGSRDIHVFTYKVDFRLKPVKEGA